MVFLGIKAMDQNGKDALSLSLFEWTWAQGTLGPDVRLRITKKRNDPMRSSNGPHLRSL